jgi:multidrug efflux pump subunit AcrA (membrane-fusion protein)
VEGSETADVAFQVSGKVSRVLVEEGQYVSKGQLIAELEPTDYRNALDAARAQREAAEAAAQKAAAGPRGSRNWNRPASSSFAGRTNTSA